MGQIPSILACMKGSGTNPKEVKITITSNTACCKSTQVIILRDEKITDLKELVDKLTTTTTETH